MPEKLSRARPLAVICALPALAAGLLAQTPDVGSGSPTDAVRQTFVEAWLRNGFNRLVGEPTGNVAPYGSTGLIQRFPSVFSGGGTLALVKPDTSERFNVMQVQAAMFAYYSSVGVANAGYPLMDTTDCPALKSPAQSANSCQWQTFSTSHALFTYTSALAPGGPQNFTTRAAFFTRWTALGGIAGLGPASSAETAVASPYNTQATAQTFDQGAIYSITSGLLNGRLLAVKQPVFDLYLANGSHTGPLGLPTGEELALANGNRRQTFEAGAIDYDPATLVALLRPPISLISLSPAGSVQMNLGETRSASVTVYGGDGGFLTDRTLAWNTTNGRVVQVDASGYAATLRAVGAGTAVITVTAEGRTSPALNISVVAPCCQIGEGAPASIRQAFQDAVTRNRLTVQLPAAAPASRAGLGYVQPLLSAAAPPVQYLATVEDGSAAGYIVTGPLLAAYASLGGPAGELGYPQSDATPGGRQLFRNGALAGSPIQRVSGAVLAKWAELGYETGPAGPPAGAAAPFSTFRGTSGSLQQFQAAWILAHATGPLASRAFAVAGPVLAKYAASAGPAGDLGAPVADERPAGGQRQQDFEGGSIAYALGSTEASVSLRPRQPLVTATPATVAAGGVVRLVAGGFPNGAALRVSQTGQPDFLVTVEQGFYAWEVRVPAAAPGGVVTVRAVETAGPGSAQASYTVRSAAAAVLEVAIASGDRQNGAPGARLPQPLVVVVRDSGGTPVPGQTVTFAASPGAQIVPASAVTGEDGRASAQLRLPLAAGIVLATATAAHEVVTFSARSAPVSLTGFPALSQDVDGALGNGPDTIRQKGALLAAAAAILRYHQARGEMPQPFGLAEPASLNQFLKSYCTPGGVCDGFVTVGASPEQTLNLWRLAAFAGNAVEVSVEQPGLETVRDLVAAGSPVLLAFSLPGGGSHFVVAKGVAANGNLDLADPGPALSQGGLGAMTGVVRLLPQPPESPGFLIAANASVEVADSTGACGRTLQFPDTAAAPAPGSLYFRHCRGSGGPYELDLDGPASGAFTDLAANGLRAGLASPASAALEVVRDGGQWSIGPLRARIESVRNAASFTEALAPGGLASIFGAGLAGARVEIGGLPAEVLAALPFQVNFRIPAETAPGAAALRLSSAAGLVDREIPLRDVAPAIFSISSRQGAVVNQDNTLNSPFNPARRGSFLVIYGTGLGAVVPSGGLNRAATPVAVVIGGVEVPASFAGLTPGAIGLYQANVQVPAALPPGLSLPVYLRQGSETSNTVPVAIQ